MTEVREHIVEITAEEAGLRLDQALSRRLTEYSRSALKGWIDAGQVTLNDHDCRPRDPVRQGDRVALVASLESSTQLRAQPVEFSVAFADAALIVVDKPAGCVVHPGAGNPELTLANGLIHRFPELAALPRAGLIHRLDKDTSGLLIVARTGDAYQRLTRAMAGREVKRAYTALACGLFVAGGTIDEPIGRDPSNRIRMCVRAGGRASVTHYRVKEKFRTLTQLDVQLETGRTQIRVHLAHIGHPLVGDVRYGARIRLPAAPHPALDSRLRAFSRPALHARHLAFAHPLTQQPIALESPMPADLAELLDACHEDRATHGR